MHRRHEGQDAPTNRLPTAAATEDASPPSPHFCCCRGRSSRCFGHGEFERRRGKSLLREVDEGDGGGGGVSGVGGISEKGGPLELLGLV